MGVLKLGLINGKLNLSNEIICSSWENAEYPPKKLTVFFGGDVQDYPEVMSSHRDHGRYLQWNLLNMVTLLSLKFPSDFICIIKPRRMELKTFSCYDNFVPSNDIGTPSYTEMHGALSHLQSLITNALLKVAQMKASDAAVRDSCSALSTSCDIEKSFDEINLIGFSKGCAVLNQLINEVHTITVKPSAENEKIKKFWGKVRNIYWLDGGHSGGKNTWITDRVILGTLSTFPNLTLHVHVTPYQVQDDRRPWIGKECKKFVDILKRSNANISYNLHFDRETPSLENHFKVLNAFKSSV